MVVSSFGTTRRTPSPRLLVFLLALLLWVTGVIYSSYYSQPIYDDSDLWKQYKADSALREELSSEHQQMYHSARAVSSENDIAQVLPVQPEDCLILTEEHINATTAVQESGEIESPELSVNASPVSDWKN
jgi:hypothetical protein